MRVKLLTSMSGPDGAVAYGEVVDLDDDTARRFIDTHQAMAVESDPEPVHEEEPAPKKARAPRKAK